MFNFAESFYCLIVNVGIKALYSSYSYAFFCFLVCLLQSVLYTLYTVLASRIRLLQVSKFFPEFSKSISLQSLDSKRSFFGRLVIKLVFSLALSYSGGVLSESVGFPDLRSLIFHICNM